MLFEKMITDIFVFQLKKIILNIKGKVYTFQYTLSYFVVLIKATVCAKSHRVSCYFIRFVQFFRIINNNHIGNSQEGPFFIV